MPLERFRGGARPAGLEKLNALVDDMNRLRNIRGDDHYIEVATGPGGAMVSLNIGSVIARMPRTRPQRPTWVLVTNNSDTDAPAGACMFRDGSAGSDSDHYGIVQPLYPGISADLLIADDTIPAGSDGLGWTMDGCEHPIYDPTAALAVGDRCGAGAGTWAATQNDLGPITVTQVADANGLARGLFHGQRGDSKLIVDNAGVVHVAKGIIWGVEYAVGAGTPGVPAVSDA